MKRFDYIRPASLAEAISAGSKPGAAYLAAGTNLLDMLKTGAMQPGAVVDITRLPGLNGIESLDDGGFRIGAMVRNSDLARHDAFRAACPSVAEALLSGASPQLRNAATVGGNLMQRNRCAYFFAPETACNRRTPGTGCDAKGGDTRQMAVLGWSDGCIATHPSDFCVPLVALDAVVEIEGPGGTRDLPLEELHLLPGETPERETGLAQGELITALRLPARAAGFAGHSRYLKVRERTSYAFALVSAAAALTLADDKIASARLALGGVAAKPWRARSAESSLEGATPGPQAYERAADLALKDARPSGANAYKIKLARRTLARALAMAAAGTPEALPALPASVFASDAGAYVHA